jgi:hypothetical protein
MENMFNIMTLRSNGWKVTMKNFFFIVIVIIFAGCAEDSLVFPVIDHVDLMRNSTHPSVTFYVDTPDTLDFQLTGHDQDGDTSTLYVDTYQGDYLTGTIIAQDNFSITSGKSISYASVSPFITTNIPGDYCLKFVLRDRKGNESFPYVLSYQVTGEPLIDSSTFNINFGNVTVGTSSPPTTVTISNNGTGILEVSILRFTGSDSSSGYQIWGFSAGKNGTSTTGLSNDATVYTCTITVDGDVINKQAISIVGSDAQTIDELCIEIQSDLNGATCTFDDPNDQIVITSSTTGNSSRIFIEDTDLFSSLTNINPSAETPVNGVNHQFNKSNDDVSLKTIGPAGSETVDITFYPKTTGTFNAVLEIPNNHVYLSPLKINLTGDGVP